MEIKIHEIKIYVMHYKPLLLRKNELEQSLNSMNLKASWIIDWDKGDISDSFISTYYPASENLWHKKIAWQGDRDFRKLNQSEISLAIKHLETMKKVIDSNFEYALFLEDDVIFDDNFCIKFDNFFKNCPDDFDFIFIGSGCGLRIHNLEPNVHFYHKDNPAGKCSDSFIISKKACIKMIENSIPFSVPIDFEINDTIMTQNMKSYWLEPSIIQQGSQNGKYKSSVQ